MIRGSDPKRNPGRVIHQHAAEELRCATAAQGFTLPVLGLGYIATYAAREGFNVGVIDVEADGLGVSAICEEVNKASDSHHPLARMSPPPNPVTPTYQGDPAIYFAHQVVDELRGGVLLVPKFQRPASTGNDEQRCRLLDSIKRRLPIGSFLLWRTRQDLPTRERAGRVTLPHPPQREDRQYVLDGLQRLTCLANAFAPPERLSPPASPEEDNDIRPIFYDLREERFTVRQGDKPLDHDLPTSALPDTRLLLQALRKLSTLEDADRLSERAEILANTIRSYKVAVIPIVSDSLDDATEAFSRVNSSGTRMNEVHMVTALTYQKGFYLTERLQERLEQRKPCGWDGIDERVVLATMRARTDLDVSDPKPAETSAKIRKNPELLDGAVTAIERVAALLREPCLVPSPYWVPYAYQTVFLADALWDVEFGDLTQAARDTLVRAFWITAYARTFIGRRTRQEKDLLRACLQTPFSPSLKG